MYAKALKRNQEKLDQEYLPYEVRNAYDDYVWKQNHLDD